MNETIIKNPLTNWIRISIINSKERLNFAVPFLSSFAISLMDKKVLSEIEDKRLVTRFDDSNLNSFDLPVLKTLLNLGFDIQYDNTIHLKLYIIDNETFVTSSNLTRKGFEDNFELTVKIDPENNQNCIDVFSEIWSNSSENKVTHNLIDNNWGKYEVLRKREGYKKKKLKEVKIETIKVGKLNLQGIIDEIFNLKIDFSQRTNLVFEANKLREKVKEKLRHKFDCLIFYAPKDHEHRRNNLFYDFVYGYEANLAGTGLREHQFRKAFEHPEFEKVVNYIYPEMIGMKSWNLSDKDEFQKFCNGIFDFDIPQYLEALPIRLASYFHPEYFISIFKLDHLKKVCEALGLETNAKSRGNKLFVYNSFLVDKMKTLPFDNYIKSNISYRILFTVELYNRLNKGEVFESILESYKEIWKKELIESSKDLLLK